MSLFRIGDYTLASGRRARFKIECDALMDEDWLALAELIAARVAFSEAVGVPRGGVKLAKALAGFATYGRRLVVDDVLTTGGSITKLMGPDDLGFVVFARGPLPPRVRALFVMDGDG